MKGVELQLLSVGIFVFGVVFAIWGAAVYRGWLFASSSWAEATRRRVYWHQMRPGISGSWLQPGVVPFALSFALLGVCGFLIGADEESRIGAFVGLLGLLGMLVSALLAWRRPSWFLAPWHRTEIEREQAGLEPLMPPPPEGRSFTMTRRDRRIGFVFVALALIVSWFLGVLPGALIGAAPLLSLLAVAEIRDR
jgi:hypothetical protein